MEVEKIVAAFEDCLEFLRSDELVRSPVYFGAIILSKQAIQIVLYVTAFCRNCEFVSADERERTPRQPFCPSRKIKEEFFNRVDSTRLVTMYAAEQDNVWPSYALGNSYHPSDLCILGNHW